MDEFQAIKEKFYASMADPKPFFPGDLGAALGILDRKCGGQLHRHRLQYLLTGVASVREMTDAQKWGLIRFVMPAKVEGAWVATFPEALERDIKIVLKQRTPWEKPV